MHSRSILAGSGTKRFREYIKKDEKMKTNHLRSVTAATMALLLAASVPFQTFAAEKIRQAAIVLISSVLLITS